MTFGCAICIFLNSENLICRSMDISKCFRGSLQLRDNESRLCILKFNSLRFRCSNAAKRCRMSNIINRDETAGAVCSGSTLFIGVGSFRILGGQGLEYWRGQGGPNSQQANDVVTTSHRRHFDVMCPLGF